MASAATKSLPAWRIALSKWAFNRSYFPQIGLMRDDLLHETPDVEVALNRISRPMMAERSFRISRAFLLSNKKEVLPKEEWTKYEEDVLYLQPYIEQAKRERVEQEAWNKQ